jgi:prolyl-tRNA synthetase
MNIRQLLGSKKLSNFFWKTYREDPQNVEAESHKLLHRTGFISQVSSGIFSFLPMGWRSIEKIKNIIREEMNNSGSLEINMPVVQPAELWEASGRLDTFIPPLASFMDRRENKYIIAPTHEETVTDIVSKNVNSYRDLPFILYHIQTKYREEPRPRGGLLRVREFEMKDAYSFDMNEEGMDVSYKKLIQVYKNIFSRCATEIVIVDADSGAIGGKESHEFIMLADSGEDIILISDKGEYSANVEKAIFIKNEFEQENPEKIRIIDTPNLKTIDSLHKELSLPYHKFLKTVIYKADDKLIGCVIRGDYKINETKVRNYLKVTELTPANDTELNNAGLTPGFISPHDVQKIKFIYDDSVLKGPGNFVAGANIKDKHILGINILKDINPEIVLDFAEAEEGFSAVDGGILRSKRGIEVGHVFKLGDAYSKKMSATYSNQKGEEKSLLMGCYGIGVGRLLAACIEANYSNDSMNLPLTIAPFSVYLLALQIKDQEVKNLSEKLFFEIDKLGLDVLYDDRDIQTGVKFNDSDLLSLPYRIVISKRSIEKKQIEIYIREDQKTYDYTYEELIKFFENISV